jgi:DNA polymerase-3 subunit epsilon
LSIDRARPLPLPPRLTEDQRIAHRAFVATLGEGAIWNDYSSGDGPDAMPAA